MSCGFPPLRAALLVALLAVVPAFAAEKGQPLPRFASLRADEVNLRAGPGERYPIDWVLTKKGLPVEVIDEFDVWRKIRDPLGSEGWVHERMLAGRRTAMVEGALRVLHASPDAASAIVARVEPGVIARLLECQGAWCRIEAQGIRGWLARRDLWGVLPDEAVQ